ncbi:MAG: insulinase family protein [Alphaproteobacteria bacterium]|jgi:predicted Zn-dependent peptidase|nr:insulinase family protein [Alphaproteobacteria bacterium]
MTIQSTVLPNGLRVVSDFIPSVETASLGVWLDVGTRNETKDINGIAHMLEHMAFKGTERRTALQIAEEIEAVGGYLNAYTGRETTAYYARILKEDAPLAVDILSDILQYSTFDAAEFQKEQSVIIQEIGQSNDTPDDIVFDYFQETCFPGHSMGWPTLGTVDVIQSLKPEIVKDYMKRHYGAKQMVFSAAGNIDHDDLVQRVSKGFTNLTPDCSHSPTPARYQGGDYRQDKELEQVHVLLGFEGVPYGHKDYYALSVLSTLLGGGMSSRLFQEIREKRGLVYTVYSYMSSYKDSGVFGIYAGTGEDEVKELFPVVCEQLKTLGSTLNETEINRAKAQLKASLMMGLESTSNRCERLANHVLIYGRPLSSTEIIKSINNVTKEDLKNLSDRLFKSPLTLTTLGPIKNVISFDEVQKQLLW